MNGQTAFHHACTCDKINIVEMMIDNAVLYKLDLITKNNDGWTGFGSAYNGGKNDVVNLIKRKMPNIAL